MATPPLALAPALNLALILIVAPPQIVNVGIELFEVLIPASQRKAPEWLSWCKLVEFCQKLLLPAMSRAEVKAAARLDLEHSHCYQRVPEYVGTELHKQHAKSHLVACVPLNGCMVYTYNFSNEGSLQRNKRIMEGSNWKDAQFRLASFTSMRLARRLRSGRFSELDQSDRVQYVDAEPTNLMLEPDTAADVDLMDLLAPWGLACFGAWEVDYVEKDRKRFGVTDWALCSFGGADSVLIQVVRMVQVSVRDESSLKVDSSDHRYDEDCEDDVALHAAIRILAKRYIPGVKPMKSRNNALCVTMVSNDATSLQPS